MEISNIAKAVYDKNRYELSFDNGDIYSISEGWSSRVANIIIIIERRKYLSQDYSSGVMLMSNAFGSASLQINQVICKIRENPDAFVRNFEKEAHVRTLKGYYPKAKLKNYL